MSTITPVGYAYSGLPQFGVDQAGAVYVRSYVAYYGALRNADRGTQSVRVDTSEWEATGRTVDMTALATLSSVAQAVACESGLEAGLEHDRIESERHRAWRVATGRA